MNTIQPKEWVEEYNVYNQTFETKEVTLFADKHEPHTGVVKKQTNKEGELIEASGKYISSMRFNNMPELRKFMFRYFKLNGKKIMFSSIFSPLQFQVNTLQINDCFFSRDKLDMRFEIELLSNFSVSLISTNNLTQYAHIEDNDFLPKKQFCVIINNENYYANTVNVLEMLSGKTKIDGISVYSSINDLPETGEDVEFNVLDVVSFDYKQFNEDFYLKSIKLDGDMISYGKILEYFSNMQFQDCIVRIPGKYMFGNNKEMEVTILPNTKVMYHFYQKGIASDEKSSQ